MAILIETEVPGKEDLTRLSLDRIMHELNILKVSHMEELAERLLIPKEKMFGLCQQLIMTGRARILILPFGNVPKELQPRLSWFHHMGLKKHHNFVRKRWLVPIIK